MTILASIVFYLTFLIAISPKIVSIWHAFIILSILMADITKNGSILRDQLVVFHRLLCLASIVGCTVRFFCQKAWILLSLSEVIIYPCVSEYIKK